MNPTPPPSDDGLPDFPVGDEQENLGTPIQDDGGPQYPDDFWEIDDQTDASVGDASVGDAAEVPGADVGDAIDSSEFTESMQSVVDADESLTESLDALNAAIEGLSDTIGESHAGDDVSFSEWTGDEPGDGLFSPDYDASSEIANDFSEDSVEPWDTDDRPDFPADYFDDDRSSEEKDFADVDLREFPDLPMNDKGTPSLFDDDQKRVMDKLGIEKQNQSPIPGSDPNPQDPTQDAQIRSNERQYRLQRVQYGLSSASQMAASVANRPSKMGPGVGMSMVSGGLSGASMGMAMGPHGAAIGAAASALVSGFKAVSAAAQSTAENLGKYSATMSVANAKAQVRDIVGDINRAQVVAPEVSRYTEATSKIDETMQNVQAAALKAALAQLVPLLEGIVHGIEKYGPATTDAVVEILTVLDAVAQAVGSMVPMGGMLKAISSTSLAAAKNLQEMNARERNKENADAEIFLDQFLESGGMALDKPWNPHPPANGPVRDLTNQMDLNLLRNQANRGF